jgi:hypothetical protein
MNQPKKSSFKPLDMNEMLMEQLSNSKFMKIPLIIVLSVGGLFALGFVFKAVNYTAHNLKILQATIKR